MSDHIERRIRWFHFGALHLAFVNHRYWPMFHSDYVNRAPYRRIHVGRFCLRLRVGDPRLVRSARND